MQFGTFYYWCTTCSTWTFQCADWVSTKLLRMTQIYEKVRYFGPVLWIRVVPGWVIGAVAMCCEKMRNEMSILKEKVKGDCSVSLPNFEIFSCSAICNSFGFYFSFDLFWRTTMADVKRWARYTIMIFTRLASWELVSKIIARRRNISPLYPLPPSLALTLTLSLVNGE